jgi:regulator of cell morphogenesis and NO signaling
VQITGESVIREVVLTTPGATHAFERFHVDYCCGGGSTLAEACAKVSAAVDDVIAAILEESRKPGAEITGGEMLSVPLERLVAQLLDVHHVRSRASAKTLLAQARDVAASDGRPELARIVALLERLFTALLPHLDFEERHVFPYVVALERAGQENARAPVALFSSIVEPMREMEHEHEQCDLAMHEIHTIAESLGTNAPPALRALLEALHDHEKDLVRHMHLEGNVLLPRAERLEHKIRESTGARRRR